MDPNNYDQEHWDDQQNNQQYYQGYDQGYDHQQYYEDQQQTTVQPEMSKQEYLKQQIIYAGYDGDQFAAFLQEKRPDVGIEADLYSFDELYQLVTEFQQLYPFSGQEQEGQVVDDAVPTGDQERTQPVQEEKQFAILDQQEIKTM